MMTLVAAGGKYPGRAKQPQSDKENVGSDATNPVFDRWLTHHLGRLYDPVIREPLPDDLMDLLERKLK
jgi:hypothetical protein